MRRRAFIAGLGVAALARPFAARAQEKMRRVAVLMTGREDEMPAVRYDDAFKEALAKLGWSEGRNLRLDERWSANDPERAHVLARELVALGQDAVLAASTLNLTALREATQSIPIVFVLVSDPVAQGFVSNLARPGGNITGFTAFEFSIGGKWLELLREVAPATARVGVLFNPESSPQAPFFLRSITAAAPSLSITAAAAPVRSEDEIARAMADLGAHGDGGVVLLTDTFVQNRSALIAKLALRHRVPSLCPSASYVGDGILLSYAYSQLDQFRGAAGYVDRILKGAKPGELPVQEPNKYTLAINLKTAKALGLAVPSGLIASADQVIE